MSTLPWTPDFIAVSSDGEVNPMHTSRYYKVPEHAMKVSFNFNNASGSSPLNLSEGWWNVSGFSEKIFDLFPAIQHGEDLASILSVPYGTAKWKKESLLPAA